MPTPWKYLMRMKLNILAALVSAALALQGCGGSYMLRNEPQPEFIWPKEFVSYDELVTEANGVVVTIVLKNGQEVRGELVRMDADSMRWKDSESKAFRLFRPRA